MPGTGKSKIESRPVAARGWGRGEGHDCQWEQRSFWMMKRFWNSVVVMAAQHHACTESHHIMHFERETLMVRELYLN